MSPLLRSSSLSMLAVSYIIPFTIALPTKLQIQQDAELPEILNFVPSCARNCVSAKIAPMSCVGGWVESCLCGDNPQSFKDSLWQCIDGSCGGEGSSSHQAAEINVEGICGVLVSTASTTKSTQSATEISARSGSEPFVQKSSTTTEAFVSPSVEATVSTSGTVPGAGSKTSNEEKKRARLSAPTIIGISIGSFGLFAAVVSSFVYYAVTREKKNRKKQIQSISFESCDGAAVDGKTDRGTLGSGVWMSISSSSTLTNDYHSSNQPILPIDTSEANEKLSDHPTPPVNPIAPQGFEFGESLQQRGIVVKSQKTIENPHLFLPPVITHTPASPIGAVGGMASPILALAPGNGDLPGTVISTDLLMTDRTPLNNLPITGSTIATTGYPTDLLSSSSESSKSTRSSLRSSHSPLAADISRSDTLSWRRVIDQAAGRAVTRVLHSEQSVNEEMDAARRRKSRFSRRLSRDSRADEGGLAGGERPKSGRRSPPGLLVSKRSNSDSSTNSRVLEGDCEERRDKICSYK